jgi:glycosyltransferase involved in cell wall biosynthesis
VLRILFDASDSGLQPVGGVSRVCNEILERMAKANPDFRFLLIVPIMKGQRLPKHPSIRILREFVLPRRRLFGIVNKISRARTAFYVRSFRPHIYQLSFYQAPRIKKVPTVALVYDLIDENTFNGMGGNGLDFTRYIEERIQACDAVVTVSHAAKADIVKHTKVPAEKIRVAHLGVTDSFQSNTGASKQSTLPETKDWKPYFLFVGSRFGYKNFGTVLRAWAAIRQTGLECRLVCVSGNDRLEAWEMDFLINAKLIRDLVMVGKLSEDALRKVYAEAVAFIFPSLAEGFGLPLVEAMAAGCRVIASDIPAFREIAHESVLFFDPYSANDLAAIMRGCIENPPEPARALAAKDHVRNFSWDKTAAMFAETYRSLVKE